MDPGDRQAADPGAGDDIRGTGLALDDPAVPYRDEDVDAIEQQVVGCRIGFVAAGPGRQLRDLDRPGERRRNSSFDSGDSKSSR